MIEKYRDVISGLILLLLSVAYLAGSMHIRSYGDAAVDSRFFPQLLGSLLFLLSVIQLVMGMKRARCAIPGNSQDDEPPSNFNVKVLFTLAAILAYILLIGVIGFTLASIFFLIVQTIIMAPKGQWRPLLTITVSIAFSCIVYAIFVYGFSLTLPEGSLFN